MYVYVKDLNALRILMNFWCFYLGQGKGWGDACIYMGTHIQPLLLNRFMDNYETR